MQAPTRDAWGGAYAHLCGEPVQTYTAGDGRQGLFNAGSSIRHSCGPVAQHPCGEFVTRWRSGALVNTADDQPHRCGQSRKVVRLVTVPIVRPIHAVANQPAPRPDTLVDIPEVA